MPAPEKILWYRIRNNQLGVKFRRQYALENRTFDFYAPQIKLAIELDGESHYQKAGQHELELERDKELFKTHGIKTLRFLNTDINFNVQGALEVILKAI